MDFGLDKCTNAVSMAGEVEKLKHPTGPPNDFSESGPEKSLTLKKITKPTTLRMREDNG